MACIIFHQKQNEMKKMYAWGWALIASVALTACGGPAASTTNGENAETAAAEETPKQWTEVARLTGSGDKKSDVFTLGKGKSRLRYDFKAGQFGGMLGVYVVEEGVDIMRSGGIPEVMVNESEEGESSLSHLSAGNYYLNVMGVNGKWTVIVEEFK